MDVDSTWRGQDAGRRCLTGLSLAGKIQPSCTQVCHSVPCSVSIGSLSPGDWRLNCSPTGQEPSWSCLSEVQDISSHETCSKAGTPKGQGQHLRPSGSGLRPYESSMRIPREGPKCTVVARVSHNGSHYSPGMIFPSKVGEDAQRN